MMKSALKLYRMTFSGHDELSCRQICNYLQGGLLKAEMIIQDGRLAAVAFIGGTMLEYLVVDPTRRQSGIGSLMIKALISKFRHEGKKLLQLECVASLIPFYQRYGAKLLSSDCKKYNNQSTLYYHLGISVDI